MLTEIYNTRWSTRQVEVDRGGRRGVDPRDHGIRGEESRQERAPIMISVT